MSPVAPQPRAPSTAHTRPSAPERTARSPRSLVGIAISVMALALGIVVVRVTLDSKAAYRAGRSAEARGAMAQALDAYQHAARMYYPGNPFSGAAFDRLHALAGAGEKAGDRTTLRGALEAFRAAALGSRSLFTPQAARLKAVDERLAWLYADMEMNSLGGTLRPVRRTHEAFHRWHGERLAHRPGPSPGHAAVALAGFALWVLAVVLFIRRGLDPALRVNRGPALVCAVAFAIGFSCFLLGLSHGA